ncbi:hypothetical protein PROFFT_A_03100 [Candidatus Profftia tarda]|uniref:Uncharacterized protein n=1 Tax=Candidatus Profftia tarda TaxID=1177216 RepID=A0A8E4EYB6_9ENTR|nr:hypothetical protein PROFFT_A_03100 [Candidatus Profftia tarda]
MRRIKITMLYKMPMIMSTLYSINLSITNEKYDENDIINDLDLKRYKIF